MIDCRTILLYGSRYTEIPEWLAMAKDELQLGENNPKSELLIDINKLRLSEFVMKWEGKSILSSMSYPSFKISIKSSYVFIMIQSGSQHVCHVSTQGQLNYFPSHIPSFFYLHERNTNECDTQQRFRKLVHANDIHIQHFSDGKAASHSRFEKFQFNGCTKKGNICMYLYFFHILRAISQ